MLEVSSNIYEKLIDVICDLFTKDESIRPDVLFNKSCEKLKLEINCFYKEDIVHIGLYSCQIILNDNIYLNAVSGSCKNQAYENVVRRFINLCFLKKDISFQYPEYNPESFYLELKESIAIIELSNTVRNKLKTYFQNEIDCGRFYKKMTTNYRNAKNILSKDNIVLTETYRIAENNCVVCSIFVNDILLLQQGDGKDNEDALENTFKGFLIAYGIVSKERISGVSMSNGDVGVTEMLNILGRLFREKKRNVTGQPNYWDIIQDCAKSLHYKLIVKSGLVTINDVTIVNIEEKNEYVGNIKAGKELVQILSKDNQKTATVFQCNSNKPPTTQNFQNPPTVLPNQVSTPPIQQNSQNQSTVLQSQVYRPSTQQCMNFPKTSKIYNEVELHNLMKIIASRTKKEIEKNERQTTWEAMNREFLAEKCKLELKYNSKSQGIECVLIFQGQDMVSGLDADRNGAREAAAKNLLQKYVTNT